MTTWENQILERVVGISKIIKLQLINFEEKIPYIALYFTVVLESFLFSYL